MICLCQSLVDASLPLIMSLAIVPNFFNFSESDSDDFKMSSIRNLHLLGNA